MNKHPLHLKVAEELSKHLNGLGELIKDTHAGGTHQLPLFVEDVGGTIPICAMSICSLLQIIESG